MSVKKRFSKIGGIQELLIIIPDFDAFDDGEVFRGKQIKRNICWNI